MARRTGTTRAKLDLLRLASELRNVTEACRLTGLSRDTYYRLTRVSSENGPSMPPSIPDSRIDPMIERAVLELAATAPGFGRLMVSKILYRRGLHVSPAMVRRVWLRWDLTTPAKRRGRAVVAT